MLKRIFRFANRCKNRKLWILITSQILLFFLDLVLPQNISLLPYYWVPVVLGVLFISPLQVFLVSGSALAFAIVIGLWEGNLFSWPYLVRLIGAVAIAAVAIYIAQQRQRETQTRLQTEERYRLLAQRWEYTVNSGDVTIYQSDFTTQKVFYSPGLLKQLGYQPGEWSEHLDEWLQRLHPEDRVWIEQAIDTNNPNPDHSSDYTIEYRIQHRDGSYHWILDRGKVLAYDDHNRPLESIGTHIDITERKQAEEALSQANQKMRMASLAAGIGFWEVNFLTGKSSWDRQMWKLYGLEPDSLEDTYQAWWQAIHPDDLHAMKCFMAALEVQIATQFFETDFRIIRANDHQIRYLYSSVYVTRDQQGKMTHWSGVNMDITDQKLAEQALSRQAQTDELTGLINRRAAIAQIQACCESKHRHGGVDAVLFCDLDHFKAINDDYGHIAGDTVLRVVAERIQNAIRSNDFAARIGGDELLVLLQGVQSLENAVTIAEKLRHIASEPIETATGLLTLTLTIGVTIIQPGETVDTLIARADAAMYTGKQAGRDRVIPFTGPLALGSDPTCQA